MKRVGDVDPGAVVNLHSSYHSHHGLGGYSKLTNAHMLKCIVRGHVCCPLILDSSFIYSFKVIIVTLLDAVAIGDVLTASNNDVKPLYSLHDY